MFSNIGPFELIIVLVIALLVLGPSRLPDAGRSIGKGIREFRNGLNGENDEPEPRREPTPVEPSEPTD